MLLVVGFLGYLSMFFNLDQPGKQIDLRCDPVALFSSLSLTLTYAFGGKSGKGLGEWIVVLMTREVSPKDLTLCASRNLNRSP